MFLINPAFPSLSAQNENIELGREKQEEGRGCGTMRLENPPPPSTHPRTPPTPDFHPPPRVENGPEQGSRKRNLATWSFPCWQMWEGVPGVSQKLFGWCFRAAYANFQGWAERKQLKPKGLAGTWESKRDRVWQFWGSKSKFLTQTWRSLTLSLYSLLYQIFLCPFALCPCLHLTLKCYPMLKNAHDWDSSFHFYFISPYFSSLFLSIS